jgi:thiol-disulfide isomerase/thioredoxin
MVDTPSNMMALGTRMPEFSLEDAVSGLIISTRELQTGKGFLIMFICNHCPFVIHIRRELVAVAHEALALNFQVIAINSNSNISHPQDGPDAMKALAQSEGWKFPFVFDATQSAAKEFRAACTPDLFLFGERRKLEYRGQFDDSRPLNGKPVTGSDLRNSIRAVASGLPAPAAQKPSIGCSIKWNNKTQ